ncbi:MAG: tripartite tricarboxylate transporter substrate binding protein [Burkholderiales bacterium]|nr:tripartite tricarboxylate transporter substrate binding protein [Burkholderiales bacterium]
MNLFDSPALAFSTSLALAAVTPGAAAADWKPSKNIEVISASAAGGTAGATARLVQHLLREKNLIPVSSVVVNRPGGQQTLAMNYLAQRGGDAHYIAVASTPLLSNHITGASKQHYSDFTPLALLFTEYVAVSVPVGSPIRDAADLVARMRKDPASLSFAVGTSIGGIIHIGTALGLKAAGADIRKMKPVVFNSTGQAMAAALGGHLDVSASLANGALPHVKNGTMRVLVVTAPQRLPALQDVPTWKELGLDAVTMNWRMIIGGKGMTGPEIAYWDATLKQLADTPDWKADLIRNLQEPVYVSSGSMPRFLEEQYQQFKVVLTDLGLAK